MKPLFKQNIEKELKKGKVILWIIDLKKGQKYIEYFKSNLSSDEVEKSDKFRFKKEEIDFLLQLKWWNKDLKWIHDNSHLFSDISKLKSHVQRNE